LLGEGIQPEWIDDLSVLLECLGSAGRSCFKQCLIKLQIHPDRWYRIVVLKFDSAALDHQLGVRLTRSGPAVVIAFLEAALGACLGISGRRRLPSGWKDHCKPKRVVDKRLDAHRDPVVPGDTIRPFINRLWAYR